MHRNIPRFWLLAASLVLVLGLSACMHEEDEGPGFDMPPLHSFVVNYDDMPNTAASLATFSALSANDYSSSSIDDITRAYNRAVTLTPGTYFDEAALKVVFWKTITDIGLLVPRLAFITAFNHRPVLQDDGSWQWNYSLLSGTYTARLVATQGASQITWEMYISKSDGTFTDFNWFSGQHDLAYSSGTWTLRESYLNPVDLVGIVWNRDTATGTEDIKLTNIKVGDPENGGYLYYGVQLPQFVPAYDRFFDIYNQGAANLTEIEWNHTNLVGRMKSPNTVGVDWVYWDETLANLAVAPTL